VVDTVCRYEFYVACLNGQFRYVYVPLGGSGNVIIATLVSFTFVALWHDLKLRLLAWGWLLTLFIIPEMVLGKVFTEKKVRGLLFQIRL
jgi:D-alanyl-lipoteichoic acid acyltransferase DltB (MBOAT superfamily)